MNRSLLSRIASFLFAFYALSLLAFVAYALLTFSATLFLPSTTWSAGVFDHNATGFPLTNGHTGVACALCHINNNYALTIAPTDCGNSQCHLTTWQGTSTPVHSA